MYLDLEEGLILQVLSAQRERVHFTFITCFVLAHFVHSGTAFVLTIPFSFGPAQCFKEV